MRSQREFARYQQETQALASRSAWAAQRKGPAERRAERERRARCRAFERRMGGALRELELETFDSMPRPLKPPGRA